jgi:hypothetical protein
MPVMGGWMGGGGMEVPPSGVVGRGMPQAGGVPPSGVVGVGLQSAWGVPASGVVGGRNSEEIPLDDDDE